MKCEIQPKHFSVDFLMILSPIVVLKIICEMNVIPMMCVKKSSFLLLKRDAFRIVAAVIVTKKIINKIFF